MHFTLGKGESVAVERGQPHVTQDTLARQVCQTLGKGESNGSKLGNSKQIGPANSSLIQFPNGNQPHLNRENGFRLGWPTWPKIRFKSHAQSRWKSRVRKSNLRSIRFKPPTGSCKLSRGTFRVRMLNRCGTCLLYTSDAADE